MACKRNVTLGYFAGFGISLEQYGVDNFAVRYGQQFDGPGLTYADAAAKLGQALMHALACEGRIDNRTKAEARVRRRATGVVASDLGRDRVRVRRDPD